MQDNELKPVNNISEVAAYLGATRQTVAAYLRKGVLKGVREGRRWYISRAHVEEFLEIEPQNKTTLKK